MSIEKLKSILENNQEKQETKPMPEGRATNIPLKAEASQDDINALYLASKMLNKKPEELKLFNTLKGYYEISKALDTAWGADWIPVGFTEEIIRAVEEELVVANLHKTIKLPNNPFQIFGVSSTSRVFAKKGKEGEVPSALTPDLSYKITFDAVPIKAIIEYTYELQEDSIVAMAPLLKDMIVRAVANSIEIATLDGDTSSTHMDVGVTSPEDPRRLWVGYRKYALANNLKVDAGNTPLSIDIIREMMKRMGKYLQKREDLALIVSPSSYLNLITAEQVLTVDKYGPNATIIKGELGKIFGIPIVVSSYIREDLNANGVFDNQTKNRTVAFLVYRPGFVYGKRRDITVETKTDPEQQVNKLIVSTRLDFKPLYEAPEPIVIMAYNLAV